MRGEHERIIAEQQRLAGPYAECNPSEVMEVPWLYAMNETGGYPPQTTDSGKWLVFVDAQDVDSVWACIKQATSEGRLGGRSKVATAKPNPHATDHRNQIICIFTYDWRDETDVRRVREELRRLGIHGKIAYKADADTLSGKYRIHGNTRISKYYE
jgi:hypothetical protein